MELTLVESIDELQAFQRWLGERRDWLGFDLETDGLRWWDGQVRLAQFGDTEKGWAIPYEWWPKAVHDTLTKYEGRIVGHNIKFDLHWMQRMMPQWQIPWHRIFDTQIVVHLKEPHLRAGLKAAAVRHIHKGAAEGERVLKEAFKTQGWDWATVPVDFEGYWKYGALDTVLTAALADRFYQPTTLTDIEHAVLRVAFGMERRGICIDTEYTKMTADRFQNRAEQFRSWGKQMYGINIGSNQEVIRQLGAMDVALTKRTDSGAIALDDEVLLRLIRDGDSDVRELASSVRSQRKLSKIVSTYLNKFLELADSDGTLHCSIRQLGARTGRMSVATPSLQNLPRSSEVRSAFIAREGRRLVLSDFDQIEIRLLAHFCQDPGLIAAIMEGDVHTITARNVYQDPTIDKGDPRRATSKSAVFAKVYGAGVPKFALTAGISEEMAADFMHAYDLTYPGVPNFIGKVQFVARNRVREDGYGWVTTPRGRRQVLKQGDGEYKLVNYLIQGAAADIMKTQMIALDEAGLGEYMLLPVHDEIILDVPEAEVEEVSRIINREMPIPAGEYTVPITSDLAVVQSWGEKYSSNISWIEDAFEDVFAEEIGDSE